MTTSKPQTQAVDPSLAGLIDETVDMAVVTPLSGILLFSSFCGLTIALLSSQ